MNGESLAGVWSLVSCVARDSSGTEVLPLGEHPRGLLIYTASGHMSATLARHERSPFASADRRVASEPELRSAFEEFEAYAGKYVVDVSTGQVVHEVLLSAWPNATGSRQIRQFEVNGDELVLSTPPMLARGKQVVLAVTWRRANIDA